MGTASGDLSSGTTDSFASGLARIDFFRGGDFASLGGVVDIAAPTVDSLSPSAASSILRTDALTFHVTDAGTLASITVSVAQGSDPAEVIHNGSAFVAPYSASSTRSSITNGYAYSVTRTGGWQRSSITLRIVAVDSAGNVTTETASFTVTNPPTGPVVDTFSPSDASSITRTTAVTYHVTDETSLGTVVVYAAQGSDPVETVHDGTSFLAPYAAGSTRSSISGGYSYSIVRAGGWQRSALTVTTKAVDGQGNITTTSASFTVTNPPAAPVVDTFSPAAAASILRSDALTFHVTDETSLASIVITAAQGSDPVEVVYDGSFRAPYAAGSTRGTITDGYSFSVVRAGGWQRSSITLTCKAVDGQGNVTTQTASFTVTNPPAAPTVDNFDPADESSIAKTASVSFEVHDETGLLRVVVYATHSTGLVELVHDGSAFQAPYDDASTRSAISDGYGFELARTGGWPAAGLVLTVIATDGQANVTTATYTLTITDAPAVDTGSPSISNVTPAPGSPLTPTSALGFDVTDDSGLFRRITVSVSYANGRPDEVVYDRRGFRPYYSAGSSVVSIEGGLRFSVRRAGGWPAAPHLYVDPIDMSGNEV